EYENGSDWSKRPCYSWHLFSHLSCHYLCAGFFKPDSNYVSANDDYLPDCRRHPLYALSDENKKIWHDYHYGHFDGPCHAFDWYGILEPYYRSNCWTFG